MTGMSLRSFSVLVNVTVTNFMRSDGIMLKQ